MDFGLVTPGKRVPGNQICIPQMHPQLFTMCKRQALYGVDFGAMKSNERHASVKRTLFDCNGTMRGARHAFECSTILKCAFWDCCNVGSKNNVHKVRIRGKCTW